MVKLLRRLALACVVVLVPLTLAGALAMVYVGAHAIVDAPNARATPPAREPGERRIAVGPPAATLSVVVVEPKRPARATIFVLHGIRDHKESLRHWAERLTTAGYRAVLVDSRGHGASTGRWLTYGVQEARDLSQLIDALGFTGPLGVMGVSYGGATAIEWAAHEPRLAAAVAVAPFASLRDIVPLYVPRELPLVGALVPRWLIERAVDRGGRLAGFDPDAASPKDLAAQARAPILLVHGDQDTMVPLWNSALIVAHAPGARLEAIAGEDHERIAGDPRLWPLTLDFFAGIFK